MGSNRIRNSCEPIAGAEAPAHPNLLAIVSGRSRVEDDNDILCFVGEAPEIRPNSECWLCEPE